MRQLFAALLPPSFSVIGLVGIQQTSVNVTAAHLTFSARRLKLDGTIE
jgi:hypothetical protein